VQHAAHLVLDLEQLFVAIHIDDVDKARLMPVGFPGDQAALRQPLVRTREGASEN
jgi:hypothetical protein